MRQRLGLAAALLRAPRLLVLDEPTNGLDPQGIREVRDLLLELNEAGTTVFLSSHLLSEIEALCTRVGVLDRGRLVAQEQLDVLQAPTGRYEVLTPDVAGAEQVLGRRVEVVGAARLLVRTGDPAGVNAALVAAEVPVIGLAPERRTLEETVLSMTSDSSDRIGLFRAEPRP
jgi:ABC-2 type transport system ATP-binding protein